MSACTNVARRNGRFADSSLEKQRLLLMVLKTDPYVPLSKLAGQLLEQVDKGTPIP
jgi:hypothetical protein